LVQLNLVQLNLAQLNLVQLNLAQLNLVQLNLAQLNLLQLNLAQLKLLQLNLAQLNLLQLNLAQLNLLQLSAPLTNVLEKIGLQVPKVLEAHLKGRYSNNTYGKKDRCNEKIYGITACGSSARRMTEPPLRAEIIIIRYMLQ